MCNMLNECGYLQEKSLPVFPVDAVCNFVAVAVVAAENTHLVTSSAEQSCSKPQPKRNQNWPSQLLSSALVAPLCACPSPLAGSSA